MMEVEIEYYIEYTNYLNRKVTIIETDLIWKDWRSGHTTSSTIDRKLQVPKNEQAVGASKLVSSFWGGM